MPRNPIFYPNPDHLSKEQLALLVTYADRLAKQVVGNKDYTKLVHELQKALEQWNPDSPDLRPLSDAIRNIDRVFPKQLFDWMDSRQVSEMLLIRAKLPGSSIVASSHQEQTKNSLQK